MSSDPAQEQMDAVWKALSDPTRRAILDLLRQGPRMTTEIVDSFPEMTRFGVMKHLDVLRNAGLVNTREEGLDLALILSGLRAERRRIECAIRALELLSKARGVVS